MLSDDCLKVVDGVVKLFQFATMHDLQRSLVYITLLKIACPCCIITGQGPQTSHKALLNLHYVELMGRRSPLGCSGVSGVQTA